MFTSHFANVKNLPPELEPICIARGKPAWFSGRVELALAPTWKMLKMSRTQYDRAYEDMLSHLDPSEIAEKLGENAVLLCWEKPGEGCHRRIVAEWLESALGIIIPEYGMQREKIKNYAETLWKGQKV